MRTFTTAAAVAALMALSPAAFAAGETAQQEPKIEQKAEETGAAIEQKAEKAAEEVKEEGKQASQEIEEEARQASDEVKEEAPADVAATDDAPPAAPPQGATAAADTSGMKDVVGMAVIGQDGKEVGEVSDVLVGEDGMMQSIVVDQGGFLGIGEKSIALELSAVDIQDDGVHINMTDEQLAELPEWEPEPQPDQQQTAQTPPAGSDMPPAPGGTAPAPAQ